MQLSVIILNYNVSNFLALCLESVELAIKNLDAEIIVVDNNSPDDSCEMVKIKFPTVQLIANKENVGFAKANNQAVKLAKGKYVCILNPDTVVSETTFENCIIKANSLSNLGMLGVQLLNGKGVFLPESKRNLPTPKVSLFKVFGERFSNIAHYYATRIAKDKEGEVSILVGAFMFLEKKKYLEAEGFDERYFMYGEDIDFSYALEQIGYKNYYYGSEKIIHFKGESSFKDKEYRKRFFGAMRLFYKKHFQSSFVMNGIVFSGIKLASFLKSTSKLKSELSFSKALIISENKEAINKLKLKINVASKVISAEAMYDQKLPKNPVVCFLDLNMITYGNAIEIINYFEQSNFYFRFLPKSSQFAIGSDTSDGLGIVISY